MYLDILNILIENTSVFSPEHVKNINVNVILHVKKMKNLFTETFFCKTVYVSNSLLLNPIVLIQRY